MVVQLANAIVVGVLLLACTSPLSKLREQKKLPAIVEDKSVAPTPASVTPEPSEVGQANHEKLVEEVPLTERSLERLKQIEPRNRKQFTIAINALNRMSHRDSENREVLQALVKDQEVVLDTLQSCASSSFSWDSVEHSKFWKLSNEEYLIQFVCLVGAYNETFEFLLASNVSGKTQFKQLKLTSFYRDKNGEVQREETARLGGGRCLNSSGNIKELYDQSIGELCIWSKYRGQGMCGTKGTYKLQDSEFVLQKFTAEFECDFSKNGGYKYEQVYP